MQNYNISASIVVYNSPEDAFKTVETVLCNTKDIDFDLYVIDNNSPEKIGEKLKAQFPQPNYILLDENLGFGKGHNQVLDKISSKYHFIINPDIVINSNTVKALCDFMDGHPDCAICCPKVLNPDGSIQYIAKRRPTLSALLARRIHKGPFKKIEERYLAKEMDHDTSFEVEFCTGCFTVLRTDVFKKIKGFDPQYFLYFEDADITMEAKKHGKAYYTPDATVVHMWHRETAKSFKPFMLQLRSMFIYMKKWGYRI
ncbi:MAG: glycosyltransferase family 2 protein [Oscillospiraceae bacterium]|nr:glycosyltransferase family 2 protein [Oscillospiraceae bacterium]